MGLQILLIKYDLYVIQSNYFLVVTFKINILKFRYLKYFLSAAAQFNQFVRVFLKTTFFTYARVINQTQMTTVYTFYSLYSPHTTY